MKKLFIGITVVAVLGLVVTPAMALKDKNMGPGASASINPGFNLYIEEYVRVSCLDDALPFEVKVKGGESGGEGRLTYVVAANFDFTVTGSLTEPDTLLPGDDEFIWSASVNGGTTNDGAFTDGQVWPSFDDTANEPLEDPYEAVVAVHIWRPFNEYEGSYEAGTYSGGSLTLTVTAQT